MRGAVSLFPQYAFMAWYSVKKTQGQLQRSWNDNVHTAVIRQREK